MEQITPENTSMNNPVSPSPIGQPKNPFNTKLVAMIAGAAILVGGGVFAAMYPWGAGKTDNLVVSQTPAKTLTPTPSTSVVTDETAGWQTYRNEKYGFEVKIPGAWREETCSENPLNSFACVGFYPHGKTKNTIYSSDRKAFMEYRGDIMILFAPLRGNTIEGIEKFYKTFSPEYFNDPQKHKYIEVNGRKAIVFYNIEGVLEVDKIVIPLKEGEGYIEIQGLSRERDIFNQIFSTFKFTQ